MIRLHASDSPKFLLLEEVLVTAGSVGMRMTGSSQELQQPAGYSTVSWVTALLACTFISRRNRFRRREIQTFISTKKS